MFWSNQARSSAAWRRTNRNVVRVGAVTQQRAAQQRAGGALQVALGGPSWSAASSAVAHATEPPRGRGEVDDLEDVVGPAEDARVGV